MEKEVKLKGLKDEGLDTSKLPDPEPLYTLGEVLGHGVYSDVHIATDNQTGKSVAVKVSRITPETKEDLEEEYKILRDLSSHPNLPAFHGAFLKKSLSPTQQDQLWMVMQLCDGGPVIDLVKGLIKQNKRMSEVHIAYIIKETIKALVHLHEYHVIHRDVKGSNILLTKDGQVKLVDFGISREVPSTLGKRRSSVGTPGWMAPETVTASVDKRPYDNRADVWALGITAIELGDGRSPYQELHPTRALFQIVRNPPPTLYRPANWSQEYNDFVTECLVKNPEHRPFMNELLEHPFLTQLPENDFHMTTELKVVRESVGKLDDEDRKEEFKVKTGILKKREGEEEALCSEDLAALETVSEDSVLQQLQTRYSREQFSSFVGDVLLTFNPNTPQPPDHSNLQTHCRYKLKSRCENDPHPFSVADSAYQDMLHHDTDQHVVFLGETLSGKTTTFKLVLQHLLYLGQSGNNCCGMIEKALEVIHALSNAGTLSNGNSTRHVLQLEVTFSGSGKVTGAIFWHHLLDKWRLTATRNYGQANFHVLYYFYDSLVKAGTLSNYLLEGSGYRYLRRGGEWTGPAGPRELVEENPARFERLVSCLAGLGVDAEQTDTLWRVLAAVLLLGQLDFKQDGDIASIADPTILEKVSKLLRVESKKLCWSMLQYCVVEGDSVARQRRTAREASRARHALARSLYCRVTDFIVNTINSKLALSRAIYGDRYCVSLLDYYGFECFPTNGLEQLLVNCFNEQIHYYYNQNVFISELQEQTTEEVDGWRVQFHDNRTALDELMNKPHGLLHLIDEAAKTGQDHNYVTGDIEAQEGNRHVKVESGSTISVAHYTGKVAYEMEGMVERSHDFLPPEITEAVRSSSDLNLKGMFTRKLTKAGNVVAPSCSSTEGQGQPARPKSKWSAALTADKTHRRYNTMSRGEYSQTKGLRGTGSVYRAASLEVLRRASKGAPHLVCCVRASLGPPGLQEGLVRQQLRALAVVDTAASRKHGYSHRIPFAEFLRRYKFLAFDFDENVEETKDNCRLLLVRLKLEGYRMGKTKIFLKYYNEEYLSRLYETQVKKIIKVQSMLRAFLAKRNMATKAKMRQSSQDMESGNEEIVQD